MTPECLEFRATYPFNWEVSRAAVDSAGFIVPLAEQFKFDPWNGTLRELVNDAWRRGPQEERYYFWAAGVLPQELRDLRERASWQAQARRYPPIPAWLGENPPIQTVFVPNGEILTLGPLGLHIEDPRGSQYSFYPQGEDWYRYSADGRLLEIHPIHSNMGGHDWVNVYTDMNALRERVKTDAQVQQLTSHQLMGGYIAFIDTSGEPEDWWLLDPGQRPERRIVAAYDFLGQGVDPDLPLGERAYRGSQLHRDMLAKIYAAQVELGLTDPTLKSPYAGTPEGPVSVDPAPRPPRQFAYRNQGRPDEQRVEVRPLDDPANPYRAQYGAWDYWRAGQLNAINPQQTERMNAGMKAWDEEQKKAREEKRKPDRSILDKAFNPVYDPNDPWQPFNVQLSDEGWVIPLLEERKAYLEREAARDYRLPRTYVPLLSLYGGGVMPDEMAAELRAAKQAAQLSGLPEIPAWLAASPPRRMLAVPNGEFITYGPLGSWSEGWRDSATRDVYLGWHRYSATGELLGSWLDKNTSWSVLLNPQAPSLTLGGQTQGYQVEEAGGYLIWRKPKDQGNEVIAAWDYDGTPVDFSQPLTRDPRYFRVFSWEDILKGEGNAW
jgi:hypothetical protein